MKIIVIRKRVLILSLFVMIFLIIGISIILKESRTKEAIANYYLPITDKVIAIDAGHGGFDPGAKGQMSKKEDEINLEIVLKVRRLIEQGGGIVILTRETNEGLNTENSTTLSQKKNEDLRNRRILINESEPDVFISIHLNSFQQSRYYGAQTFFKKGCEYSEMLAEIVQDEFKNVLDKNNMRLPQSRYSVYLIRKSEAPAILVECGFMSNPTEERLLNESEYQEKIAWSIYVGLIKYFKEIEEES